MTDKLKPTAEQIRHMAEQFLRWKLPDPWHPDNGISFEPIGNKGIKGAEYPRNATGTNLFGYEQAVEMVRHMVDGLPECDTLARAENVEVDLLVAQFPALLNILHYHETGGHKGDGSDEALELARKELLNLAKRGVTVGEQTDAELSAIRKLGGDDGTAGALKP